MWLSRLKTDPGNLQAALTWIEENLEKEKDSAAVELGFRMCCALHGFWEISGNLEEGRKWCSVFLQAEIGSSDAQLRASTLNAAGKLAWTQSDDAAARTYYTESLEILKSVDDQKGAANLLLNFGLLDFHAGRTAEAKRKFEESLKIGEALDDLEGMSRALNNLGLWALYTDNLRDSQNYFTRSLQFARDRGEPRAIAATLVNLGSVAYQRGNLGRAKSYYMESWSVQREIGEEVHAATSLSNLAIISLEQEDYKQARKYFAKSLEITRNLGLQRQTAVSLLGMIELAIAECDYIAAERHCFESLKIGRATRNLQIIGSSLESAGKLAYVLSNFSRAVLLLAEAQRIREQVGLKLSSRTQLKQDQMLATAREQLGEEAYQRDWNIGWEKGGDEQL